MPVLKASDGSVLEPENLMLHNNEGSMLFKDKASNSLFNFDLEKGTIVD
jgi:hypothetical protein